MMTSGSNWTPLAFAAIVVLGCYLAGCGEGPTSSVIGGGEISPDLPGADDLLILAKEPNAAHYALYRFSADGKLVKKLDAGPILFMYLSANRTRIVIDRDADTLAFLDPDGANPAGLEVPNLVPWYEVIRSFTISPSGRYVAYGAGVDPVSPYIYLARTDGSAGELLFTGQWGRWAWSPVEDKLAYGGYKAPLHVYDVEANTDVEASSTPSIIHSNASQIVWSRNGERLAFIEQVPNEFVLASVDKYGQDRRVLLTAVEWPMAEGSSWSPDGRYFALMQYVTEPSKARLADENGTTSRDVIDAEWAQALGWSPTGHFVYQQKDTAIKSVSLTGPILDLVGPGSQGRRLGPNGRLMHVEYISQVGTMNADGTNPITFPQTAFCSTTQLSADGKFVAFGPIPDAKKNVSIYAAASDGGEATLVLTATNQVTIVGLDPIADSSGIVFEEDYKAGWILPTSNGFKAIYPQPPLADILWAQAIK